MSRLRPPTAGDVFTELSGFSHLLDRGREERIRQAARRVSTALRDGGAVLDIGCGTGAHLARIRSEAHRIGKPIGTAVGIDVAEGMIERARLRRGVRAVPGDAAWLPFADQVFDVVFSSHVLQFVDDPVRAAREMFRVALPGGTIIVELPASLPSRALARRLIARLPRASLLRQYLEIPRSYEAAAFRRTLASLRCEMRLIRAHAGGPSDIRRLARIARASGTDEDYDVARELEAMDGSDGWYGVLIARLPGPRTGSMPVTVTDLHWTPVQVQRLIADLPPARGYELIVKPLRYRTRPHVQAFCEFDTRRIIIQVPVPFRPFTEAVPYRAQRMRAKGFRFRWYRHELVFEKPAELIRYLYLHEYYHWYLREVMGRPSAAETACDRFALQRL